MIAFTAKLMLQKRLMDDHKQGMSSEEERCSADSDPLERLTPTVPYRANVDAPKDTLERLAWATGSIPGAGFL